MNKTVWESESVSRVLAFFCLNSGNEFYSHEVNMKTRLSAGSVNKACRNLAKNNFLNKTKKGKEIFYTFNYSYAPARAFKIFLTVNELQPLVKKFAGKCKKILLYGSKARGTDQKTSDFDILIETNSPDADQIAKSLMLKNAKYSIKIKTTQELFLLKEKDPVFYEKAVLKGFVVYSGEENENV